MKAFSSVALAALMLLVPTLASAQGVTMVYRPELRGMVAVPAPQSPALVEATPPTPAQVIARHQAMAVGLRANANTRGGAALAADHCDRLIAAARDTVRKSF